MTRDPRIYPKPGDVVLVDTTIASQAPDRGGYRREVDMVRKLGRTTIVSWTVGRLGYDATLTKWRELNRNAEVIHVAAD